MAIALWSHHLSEALSKDAGSVYGRPIPSCNILSLTRVFLSYRELCLVALAAEP